MSGKAIISAVLVLVMLGASFAVVADESSAGTCGGVYEYTDVRSASVFSISWSGTDVPEEYRSSGSSAYYDFDGHSCYVDRSAFIYVEGSEKDRQFRDWIDSRGASGSVSESDSVVSGKDFVLYVFYQLDLDDAITEATGYKNDKDKLSFVCKQEVYSAVFKQNDFSFAIEDDSDVMAIYMCQSNEGEEMEGDPGDSFENKYEKEDKTEYIFDCEEEPVRVLFSGTFDDPSSIGGLKDAYLSDISYSTFGEWSSDSDGSGMLVLALVLLALGLVLVVIKYVINRAPGWSK